MLRSLMEALEGIVYSDRFSGEGGVLQRLDPRAKLACFMAFILTAVASKTFTSLTILFLSAVSLSLLSDIPLKTFFLRGTVFVPAFTAVIVLPLPFITPGAPLTEFRFLTLSIYVTWEGIRKAIFLILRVWVCVSSLTLLILTTKFTEIVQAMERFKFPKVFVVMTTVTYRFIFLFIDEAYRLALARETRLIRSEGFIGTLKSLARIVSTLFIRAYERGERVYLAMLARGYMGELKSMPDMQFKVRDWVFMLVSFTLCSGILLYETLSLGGV